MTDHRQINAYDFARAMHALRSQQMSAMFATALRTLFGRKPVFQPRLG